MKKIIVSLLMIIILMINIVSVGAVSTNEYHESSHNYIRVSYKIDENNKWSQTVDLINNNAFPVGEELKNRIIDDKMIIGWKDNDGHEYLYRKNTEFEYTDAFDVKPGDEITLTPIYASLSITPDETFSFCNDYIVFKNAYKMTDAHTKRLRECYCAATWYNQFGLIGIPLGLFFPDIYQKLEWVGSCCGFPIAALMQHYGMIDLRTEQGVEKVSDIKPTEQIVSALNFYNAVTPAAIVCSNKAPEPGTDAYKAQIKKLFETVSSGKPAVCFIYCGGLVDVSYKSVFSIVTGILSKGREYMEEALFVTHCILLTGAYTNGNGTPVFVGYDENYASYCNGLPQLYTVSGDFEDVFSDSSPSDSLKSIAWLSDPGCLESFKADEKINPLAWYSYYRSNRDSL